MSGRREPGVKWTRPPEFRDDLDVSDLYERLLSAGEVTVTHEFRTKVARPGEVWMPPTGPAFERYMQDLFAVRNRIAALARRAAEDGLKIQVKMDRRETFRRRPGYSRQSQRVVLDGPLSTEFANPAERLRAQAGRLFAKLLEKGETFVSPDYSGHALLPIDPTTFLFNELQRLAGEAGVGVSWSICDDIGFFVRIEASRASETSTPTGSG